MRRISSKAKILSQLLMALFVVLGIFFGIFAFRGHMIYHGIIGVASLLFLLVPSIMKRLHIRYTPILYSVFFAFMIVAYDIGFVYQRYGYIPHYDKVAHFLSGIAFTIVGFCVYYYLHRSWRASLEEKWILSWTYALFFSLFSAVFWEICEFTGFILTGHDSQGHLTTGVFDTMVDLISCLIGSVISVVSYILTVKRRVKLLTGAVVEEFYNACRSE